MRKQETMRLYPLAIMLAFAGLQPCLGQGVNPYNMAFQNQMHLLNQMYGMGQQKPQCVKNHVDSETLLRVISKIIDDIPQICLSKFKLCGGFNDPSSPAPHHPFEDLFFRSGSSEGPEPSEEEADYPDEMFGEDITLDLDENGNSNSTESESTDDNTVKSRKRRSAYPPYPYRPHPYHYNRPYRYPVNYYYPPRPYYGIDHYYNDHVLSQGKTYSFLSKNKAYHELDYFFKYYPLSSASEPEATVIAGY